MKNRFELKSWETLLLVTATIALILTSSLYFSGISLRKYVFGNLEDTHDEQNLGESVGKVQNKTGVLRRQKKTQSEFTEVQVGEPLYNFDTLVTSSAASATLQLEDGGTIDLGSSTMVRLNFETSLSLGGISRAAAVQVVTGQVSGRAQSRQITLRAKNKTIQLAKSSPVQKIEVPPAPLIKPPPPPAPLLTFAASPLPILPSKPAPIIVASPSPVVSAPPPAVLKIESSRAAKKLSSPLTPPKKNLLPSPELTLPSAGASFSKEKTFDRGEGLFMTWRKMDQKGGYEIQISNNPEFQSVLLEQKLKENFFLLKSLPVGQYVWRVRQYSKGVYSPYALPRELTIEP